MPNLVIDAFDFSSGVVERVPLVAPAAKRQPVALSSQIGLGAADFACRYELRDQLMADIWTAGHLTCARGSAPALSRGADMDSTTPSWHQTGDHPPFDAVPDTTRGSQ